MIGVQQAVSSKGRAFIEGFESLVLYPYDDLLPPVGGVYREWKGEPLRGTATIGYGHTDAAKYPLRVTPGLRITQQKGDEILDVDLDECETAVNQLAKVELTQGEFDALTSFSFNCGVGALQHLIAHGLNDGNYDATRSALDLYVYSGGQRLLGLQRRRDGEQGLWDDFAVAIPTEIIHHTANVDTPHDLRWIQEQLNALGQTPALDPDGRYGRLTEVAIATFIAKARPQPAGVQNDT